jgi:hypothetical protein
LYESVSYRDKDGKPRNKRSIIGKFDPQTGDPLFKPDYVKKMQAAGTPVAALVPADTFNGNAVRNSIIKEYGAFYFYQCVASQIGLLEILKEVFPHTWREVFDLACFTVSTGDPMMYCEGWLEKTEAFEAELSSPQASLLLQSLDHEKREQFFRAWGAYRKEREYLALDITSVSSYSQLIDTVE